MSGAVPQRQEFSPLSAQQKALGKKSKPEVCFKFHIIPFILLTRKYDKVNVEELDERQKKRVRILHSVLVVCPNDIPTV